MVDVLVVEDSRDFAELLELVLNQQGHTVHIVFDGIEAIDYLSTNSVQLIIIDLIMPRMGAEDFIRERSLRNIAVHTPVLLMSGLHEELPGFDGYLAKPFETTSFGTMVSKLLTIPYSNEVYRDIVSCAAITR